MNRMAREPSDDSRNSKGDDRLRLLIERIENLEAEKVGIASDVKDVYAEAKAVGYDAKVMRAVIRERKKDPKDRREFQSIFDLYANALGLELL